MSSLTVGFKLLTRTAKMPCKARPSDLGLDLFADETRVIPPGQVRTVRLGVAAVLPPGWGLTLWGRSGLGALGVGVLAGVVDPGYVGQISAVLCNCGSGMHVVNQGDRVVQALLTPCPAVEVVRVDELPETGRGADGFGSTGR